MQYIKALYMFACVCELVFQLLHAIDTFTKRKSVTKQRDKACKQYINRILIQSNLGFRTFRSSNNSVFERKIKDENHSVLEQKFGSQTTQEEDLPEPKRQRIEKTPSELSEVLWKGISHPRNGSSLSSHHFASKQVYICAMQHCNI